MLLAAYSQLQPWHQNLKFCLTYANPARVASPLPFNGGGDIAAAEGSALRQGWCSRVYSQQLSVEVQDRRPCVSSGGEGCTTGIKMYGFTATGHPRL